MFTELQRKLKRDPVFGKENCEVILPPIMYKSVILRPSHSKPFNADGSINKQFRVKGPGAYYDKGTGKTILLYTGIEPILDSSDDVVSMTQNPTKHYIFGAHSDDMLQHLTYFDSTTHNQQDRSKLLPILSSAIEPNTFLYGKEDPRITPIEWFHDSKAFLITVTALNKAEIKQSKIEVDFDRTKTIRGVSPEIYLTTDLLNPSSYIRLGLIGPEGLYFKNLLFHQKLIYKEGSPTIVLFTRILPGIQAFTLPLGDLPRLINDSNFRNEFWNKTLQQDSIQRNTVLKPVYDWEGVGSQDYPEGQISPGAPPFEVNFKDPLNGTPKKAWMFIYNAVPHLTRATAEGRVVGVALLDYNDPTVVISRSPLPIIQPDTSEEKNGKVPNITFATGAFIDNQGSLRILYSSGDTTISMASCKLDNMMEYLLQFDAKGKIKSLKNFPLAENSQPT